MNQFIKFKIKSRIYGKGRGWCFTPKHFTDLGSTQAINTALFRLKEKGFIRQVSHGLYEYPRIHEILGELPPDLEKVTSALAEKHHIKIQPSGAYAANLLGLSEQVPGKIVFLTEGFNKIIKIGNVEIQFRKTTPKMMKTAGKISGLVIQALKYFGKENITDDIIRRLQTRLSDADKKRLKLDADLAPAWISKIIKHELVDEKKYE